MVKQGKGLVIAQTFAGTLSVVLISIIWNIMTIQNRAKDAGAVNPTDQVILANHLLEASLMGISLVLGLIIDRLHYFIKELHLLRKSLEALRKESRRTEEPKEKN